MEHEGEVRAGTRWPGRYRYSARCSCGWEGDSQQTEHAAWDDYDEHRAAIR